MKRLIFSYFAAGLLILSATASADYSITSAVISGGGTTSTGGPYTNSATIGQPTPLETVEEAATTVDYQNKPGFWQANSETAQCDSLSALAHAFGSVTGDHNYDSLCDFPTDGDVDGMDLIISRASISTCSLFLSHNRNANL